MLADLISGELPYLRRYARALLGTKHAGDAAVEAMLETKMLAMLHEGRTLSQRKDLFRTLDETIMEELASGPMDEKVAHILKLMTLDERRAVILTAVEGFSIFETADILCTGTDFVERALLDAEASLRAVLRTGVLIIEDEALISSTLADIVQEAGHTVLGKAATASEARQMAARHEPGLILCDIALADGSSGLDAIDTILNKSQRNIPVVYITAYPERLLQGNSNEPAFLVTKPFQPGQVRALVEQAVMSTYLPEPA